LFEEDCRDKAVTSHKSDTSTFHHLNRRYSIRQTIRYEILKNDLEGNPRWLESVEGLEQATNRIEELAASDPSFDYYLYCVQADKFIRRLQRTSPRLDVLPGEASQRKAG
jgi:hypothetical protein